jgi:hypothetical protein
MVNCSMFCIYSERNFEGAQLGWKYYLLFCAFYPSIMVWYIPGVRSGVGVELVLDSFVMYMSYLVLFDSLDFSVFLVHYKVCNQ